MAEETNNTPDSNEPAAIVLRGPNQTSRYADTSALTARFAASIEEIIEALGEVTVVVKREGLIEILAYLRDEPSLAFNYLSDLSGVDLGEYATPRFVVAYHLFSIKHGHRLRLKVFLTEEDTQIPTASEVWQAANWMEREVFDMYGIDFVGHPDLRRILMPADYEGHPLRKDFPVRGY